VLQRYLQPDVLAGISGLELVAKTVVDGFLSGLHRSPTFGFSQEFAEYRAYYPGDDLRHVDWNVFARSEKMYLKRYKGETNCQTTFMLDASASMQFGSGQVSKIAYAKYLVAALAYMAVGQRDATGLCVFDDDVRGWVQPSTRQGQLHRILNTLDKATPGKRTSFAKPFVHVREFLHRRGLLVIVSDLWEDPETIVKVMEPMRHHGNEVVVFHLLDEQELRPKFKDPVLLEDMESGDTLEVTPQYAATEYKQKIEDHCEAMASKLRGAGLDYTLVDTSRPLDEALRGYLAARKGRM